MMKKRMSGLLLAEILFLSSGTTALAAESTIPDIKENLKVKKNFEMAEGLKTPVSEFEFQVQAQTPKEAPDLTINKISYAEKDEAPVVDGKITISKEATIQLPEASGFPHAGEYVYTLTEQNGGASNITYSDERYTLRIRVKNDGEGLAIASVTAEKGTANGTEGNKTGEIVFTNTYAKNDGKLTIEKQTTGDYADKTKKFKFQITFTENDANKDSTYNGKIGETEIDCTPGQAKAFELAHGEKLVFTGLPVGTRYVVEELGAKDGYTPSVSVVENGMEKGEKTASDETQGISSATDGSKDSLVGENNNQVTFENSYHEIAVTGIVMNNLPFILLIGVAAAAFGILAFMKKKVSGKK